MHEAVRMCVDISCKNFILVILHIVEEIVKTLFMLIISI